MSLIDYNNELKNIENLCQRNLKKCIQMEKAEKAESEKQIKLKVMKKF